MSDYMMREDAPITEEVWAAIDEMVVTVVKKNLVGRRVIDLVGPLGWGVEVVPRFEFTEQEGAAIARPTAEYIPLEEISQEFMLRAKQIVISQQTPHGLDLGAVAIAATNLAKAEDRIMIGGLASLDQCAGELGDWDTLGGPFRAIADAVARLRDSGFDAPFAAIMSPAMYARLASLFQHGRRELDLVRSLLDGGVFQSTDPAVAEQVLVLSPQAWNMDLVVGQDVATAWLGNEGLDQRFRVFESLVLRVKRPGAVCVLR
jgi:uncharacterized linocin/CFP29 family protein